MLLLNSNPVSSDDRGGLPPFTLKFHGVTARRRARLAEGVSCREMSIVWAPGRERQGTGCQASLRLFKYYIRRAIPVRRFDVQACTTVASARMRRSDQAVPNIPLRR